MHRATVASPIPSPEIALAVKPVKWAKQPSSGMPHVKTGAVVRHVVHHHAVLIGDAEADIGVLGLGRELVRVHEEVLPHGTNEFAVRVGEQRFPSEALRRLAALPERSGTAQRRRGSVPAKPLTIRPQPRDRADRLEVPQTLGYLFGIRIGSEVVVLAAAAVALVSARIVARTCLSATARPSSSAAVSTELGIGALTSAGPVPIALGRVRTCPAGGFPLMQLAIYGLMIKGTSSAVGPSGLPRPPNCALRARQSPGVFGGGSFATSQYEPISRSSSANWSKAAGLRM
jgi:hypothetical protein